MYLTRMFLNRTRLTTRRMLASPQVAHALVIGSVPPASDPGRVLWRIDQRGNAEIELYIASARTPDLTGIVEQAGWPTKETWRTAPYDGFLTRLERGQRWLFRLTANPTRSISQQRGERGKVVPCRTVTEQTDWLMKRSTSAGFRIPENELDALQVELRDRKLDSFDRRTTLADGERRDRVSITRVTYDGMLQVEDAELLRASLTNGIGRAKAYGCGLLTLAPAQ